MDNKKIVALVVYSLLSTLANVLGGTGVISPITGGPSPCSQSAPAQP